MMQYSCLFLGLASVISYSPLSVWFYSSLPMYIGVTIGLQEASYTANETGGPVSVCAELFAGSLETNISMTLVSTNGTAKGIMPSWST